MKAKSLLNKFSSKGFTLIELLIVIAILGILAAAVLIAINPGQRIAAARNSRVRSDLVNVGNAANVFNADTGLNAACVSGGTYPTTWGVTLCGVTFMAQPVPPTGAYAYKAQTTALAACTAASMATACARVSVSGPAYTDGVVDAATNTSWCWRSVTGTITQVANAAACTP